MADNVPISRTDLEAHLEEQLSFIEASAAAYDSGFESEAKRLAVTLRVLLHDTRHSKSLLGQLGKMNGRFLDTALDLVLGNVASHGGLVMIAADLSGGRYVAMLDDVPIPGRWLEFAQWWGEPVFVDKQKRKLSRGDLVLTAANQDGGAHVDPVLDATYADLAKNNSLAWEVCDGKSVRPMGGPEKAAIRQIAHEVLKTLRPGYAKKPTRSDMVVIGGVSITAGAGSVWPKIEQARASRKVHRNETCPCGSGLKYKRCHGKVA